MTAGDRPPDGSAKHGGLAAAAQEQMIPGAAPAIEVVSGAAAAAPTPTPISTPSPPAETNPTTEPARVIAERTVSQVTERLEVMARDGVQEARVRLNPPELGEVRLRLTVDNGTLDVHLAAERPATREMLTAALQDLRQALEARSLSPQRLDVDSGGSGSAWGGRGTEPEPGDAHRHRNPTASYADPGASPSLVQRRRNSAPAGRIDYRA